MTVLTHLTFYFNVELPDTLEGQFLFLYEDPDWFPHESGGHLQYILGHGSGEQDHLDLLIQVLEHIVDLILESTAQHLVGLIQNKDLNVTWICNKI